MMTQPYVIYYLPAIIIALLAIAVLVLVWQLVRSLRTCRQMGEQLKLLQREKTETELELSKVTEILAIKESREQKRLEAQNRLSEECTLSEEDFADGAKMTDNMLMIRIERLVERNIGNPEFTASTIAEVFALSRAQLDRRMKAMMGKTATAYVQERRLETARELLLTTEKPVVDVAMACGFEDTSYFTRVFKQHYGNTPSGVKQMKIDN